MQGAKIFQTYHIPGTLTANIVPKFTVPCDLTLVHVSAVASNDSDATLILGTSTDDDAYLAAATIGDSGAPREFDRNDFVDAQYPHILDGTVVVVTLDYDSSSGTAAANVTIVLTFVEG
jgi:hypothetical protein